MHLRCTVCSVRGSPRDLAARSRGPELRLRPTNGFLYGLLFLRFPPSSEEHQVLGFHAAQGSRHLGKLCQDTNVCFVAGQESSRRLWERVSTL